MNCVGEKEGQRATLMTRTGLGLGLGLGLGFG